MADGLLSIPLQEGEERSYSSPAARNIVVNPGQKIQAATPITSGQRDPKDVLRISGRDAVLMYLVIEVQRVHRYTGVYCNDTNIEVIISQMIRSVKLDDTGDTVMHPNVK